MEGTWCVMRCKAHILLTSSRRFVYSDVSLQEYVFEIATGVSEVVRS